MLSVAMIVRNEGVLLEQTLLSCKNLADEIVVVDTGSSDNTKEIAGRFTDKIYDFKWCEDFSKARNFSIDKVTNDWILVLDGDEIVEYFDKKTILNFIENPDNLKVVGRIHETNILHNESEGKKSFNRVNRLFNKKYNYYEGIIHEQIVSNDGNPYRTINIDIYVKHIGYSFGVLNRTSKLKRNLDLLKEAIKKNEEDPYLYYQLGKTYYLMKDYNEANISFKKALRYNLNYNLEYVADLIETYGYCLINSNQYLKALTLEKYYNYYKSSPDFTFVMALIYMNNGKFSMAVEKFLLCTNLNNPKVDGVNSFLAYKNIGIIYEVLGFYDEAIKYYDLAQTNK